MSGCANYAEFELPELPKAPELELVADLGIEPLLRRNSERDILNPSIVRNGNVLFNFYSEFDGHTWRTALAASLDGHGWARQGRVLAPDPKTWEGDYIAANGSALFDGRQFFYWYQAGEHDLPSIGLARSSDGRTWRKEQNPVLTPGPRGSWDERGAADPYVLKLGGFFYVYYLGQNRAHQQQIGLARSEDGVHWTKLRSNPVVTMPWPGTGLPGENGLGEPAVWQSNGWYWMLLTGRARTEERSLIPMRSRDGVHWTRAGAYILGNAEWDRAVVCDPTVLPPLSNHGGKIRLWFGGGDKARPDENLDGQIGEGQLHIVAPGPSN